MGMDEYADSMACFAATHFHIKRKERESGGEKVKEKEGETQGEKEKGETQGETQGENEEDNEEENEKDNEEESNGDNNAETNGNKGNDYQQNRKRGRGGSSSGDFRKRREEERAKLKEEKDKLREEKRKRKTTDYSDAYYYCWDLIVQSTALFDEFPLSDPALTRLNRYLTTLLHRHLAKRAKTYKLLKMMTQDRYVPLPPPFFFVIKISIRWHFNKGL